MSKQDDIQNVSLMSAVIFNNVYTAVVPWIKSIGFHTNQSAYRERSTLNSQAEIYLTNSTHRRNDSQSSYSILNYLGDAGVNSVALNGHEDNSEFFKINLPEGAPIDLALGEALANRRSIRQFTGDSVEFDYLATVLRAGGGISSTADSQLTSGGSVKFSFRTYPSAGALYPVSLYVAAINVNDLSKGIYRYHPSSDALLKISDKDACENLLKLSAISDDTISLLQASFVILLVIKPWKSMRKYGDRGLRFNFMESGMISQNINLAATALGLGGVDCASFYEEEVNELLHLDGVLETFVHAIILGVSS